jgi:hypothetical protein
LLQVEVNIYFNTEDIAGIDNSDKNGKIALDHYHPLSIPTTHNTYDGWATHPIIVPPVVYKQNILQEEWATHLQQLWARAKLSLSRCKHLIVIGYSFPPTDFHMRQLFLEAFSDNELESLVIVNPDTSVIQKIKSLCHFGKPVTACKNLDEFLKWRDDKKIL